jgi:hypothetical protein
VPSAERAGEADIQKNDLCEAQHFHKALQLETRSQVDGDSIPESEDDQEMQSMMVIHGLPSQFPANNAERQSVHS